MITGRPGSLERRLAVICRFATPAIEQRRPDADILCYLTGV